MFELGQSQYVLDLCDGIITLTYNMYDLLRLRLVNVVPNFAKCRISSIWLLAIKMLT